MKSYGRNENVHHYLSFFPCYCDNINLMQKRFSFLFVYFYFIFIQFSSKVHYGRGVKT